MLLIIFPIIIGLCVLGLIFLVFKKIPQIANYSVESPLAPAPNPANAMPSEVVPKKTVIWEVFFSTLKKYYLGTKQIFSQMIKKVVSGVLGLARKIKPAVLGTKKIAGLRQRLAIRKKGDFNQLNDFFNKKRPTLILPQATPDPDNDKGLSSMAPKETEPAPLEDSFITERTNQDHLDFKKFLNNGGQEKKSYKLEKFSFDQLFKKAKSQNDKPETTEPKNRPSVLRQSRKDVELAKFVQKEQALIQQIANEPHNASLYNKLGGLYLKVKNWQDAKASFNYLLELEPRNKKAFNALDKINKVLHNK